MDFSEQIVATSALAGYLPLVRNSGNDWTTSAAPYPGDEGGDLPGLLVAMRGEASLGLNSLRMRVPASEEAHYGMLRYDALGTGQAALVAMNLGSGANVQLDLAGLPPQLLGQRPTSLLCASCPSGPPLANHTSLAVRKYGYASLVGLQLPRWTPQGYLTNCSATYAPPAIGEMPLTECLVACLRDAKCDGVTVDWIQPHAWPRPASMKWFGNQVRCHVRGGIDLAKCEKDATEAHSTITVVPSRLA